MSSTRILEKGASYVMRTLQHQPTTPNYINPFLQGVYAPVAEEKTITTQLRVDGEIPASLNGIMTRIGPNPMAVKNPKTYHWFMGDGMVHGLRLRDGQAIWYRNRYIGANSVQKRLSRPLIQGQQRGVHDVVNTNVVGHAGQLWAIVEGGGFPIGLDHELNSVKQGLFHSDVSAGFSAHPHCDPQTGELHAVCYDGITPNSLQYVVIDQAGQVRHQVQIPVQHGPMVHDCALTQKYVVVFDLPVTFSFKSLLKGNPLPYAWNNKHNARIGLLPRDADDASAIRWVDVEPCFSFHVCNAFDQPNGDTVIDLVVHERMFHRSVNGPETEFDKVKFERWTIAALHNSVTRRVISDTPQEFPRMDERLTSQPYQYAYSITTGGALDQANENQLLRHDVNTGEVTTHAYGFDKFTSEVVFVPKSPTSTEADGWLISYVHDLNCGESQVVILDSQKLGQAPQAVIHLGAHVPMGFHASWVADTV